MKRALSFRCDNCQVEFDKPHVQQHTDLIAYGSCVTSEVTHVTRHCPECGCEDYSELESLEEA